MVVYNSNNISIVMCIYLSIYLSLYIYIYITIVILLVIVIVIVLAVDTIRMGEDRVRKYACGSIAVEL